MEAKKLSDKDAGMQSMEYGDWWTEKDDGDWRTGIVFGEIEIFGMSEGSGAGKVLFSIVETASRFSCTAASCRPHHMTWRCTLYP